MDYNKFTYQQLSDLYSLSLSMMQIICDAHNHQEDECMKCKEFRDLWQINYDCFLQEKLKERKKPE